MNSGTTEDGYRDKTRGPFKVAKFYPSDDVMLNGSADVASAGQWARRSCVIMAENIHQNQIDQLISCRPGAAADTPGMEVIHVFQAL